VGHIVHYQLIKEVWEQLIMNASNSINYKQQVQVLLISWLMLWDLMSCHRSQKKMNFFEIFLNFGTYLGSFVQIF
jgi:hypothetical protein